MNSGWHGENAVVCLDGNIEIVALGRRKVITAEDDGCAWMVPTVPLVAPLIVAAAAGFVVVGDF